MPNTEELRIRKALDLLDQLDKKLANLVMRIAQEKDREDGRTLTENPDTTVDTMAMRDFIDTINSIKFYDNEDILIAINAKYDEAINTLRQAIENEDPYYQKQFTSELIKLEDNKTLRYDAIAETYKEIVDRLERGDTQKDYLQSKIDEKQGEMDSKEIEYRDKNGNIDFILASVKGEYEKIQEQVEMRKICSTINSLTTTINDLEDQIRRGVFSEEELPQKQERLEKLKNKRKELLNRFAEEARDKDGKSYRYIDQADGKPHVDLNMTRTEEAVDKAVEDFKAKLQSLPEEKRIFTLLDKDMKELDVVDASEYIINDPIDAKDVMEEMKEAKSLWLEKAKQQGYDKTKLKQEKEKLEEKLDQYNQVIDSRENDTELPVMGNGTTYKQRYEFNRKKHNPIVSFFKSVFASGKTEEEMTNEFKLPGAFLDVDMDKTKKEVLRSLNDNKYRLNGLNVKDRNKQKFKDKLTYNVKITEEEVNKFWDKEIETKEQEDDERE